MNLRVLAMRLLAPACEAQRRVFRTEVDRVQAHAEDLRKEIEKIDPAEIRERAREILNRLDGRSELA